MTYLELVREAIRDAAYGDAEDVLTLNGGDDTVSIAASRVNEAWQRIQNGADEWEFMLWPFELELVAGKSRYTPAEMGDRNGNPSIPSYTNTAVGAPEVRKWITETQGDTRTAKLSPFSISDLVGQSFGGLVEYEPYSIFRQLRVLLSQASGQSRGLPQFYTFEPQPPRALLFDPIPDESDRYVVHGMVVRAAHQMRSDNDEPQGLPEEFHQAIKWRAVMMLAGHDTAADEYQFARSEYREIYRNLSRAQLPSFVESRGRGSGPGYG